MDEDGHADANVERVRHHRRGGAGDRRLPQGQRPLQVPRGHHEGEGDMFLFAQTDKSVEELAPAGIPREVIVREEAVRDPHAMVVLPDEFDDLLRVTAPHRPPLDIDDRAEAALERASSSRIETGETAKCIFYDLNRQKRRR